MKAQSITEQGQIQGSDPEPLRPATLVKVVSATCHARAQNGPP
jgi:hypothetical protein